MIALNISRKDKPQAFRGREEELRFGKPGEDGDRRKKMHTQEGRELAKVELTCCKETGTFLAVQWSRLHLPV